MAMSKADQKAASDRIMAKYPLTPEERQTYEMLMKKPEDYVLPNPETGIRMCGICGAEFQGTGETKQGRETSALEEFSNHVANHNPSPSQWTEAHRKIQDAKEQAKRESA